jgi:CrcB protein
MSQSIAQLLLVGAGGFAGSILRYGVSGLVHRLLPMSTFPWGTMSVNATGSLLIGLLGGLADTRQILTPEARLFMFIGLLGGFTTFSTFSYETLVLMRDGEHLRAASNVMGTIVICLLAVWAGYGLGRVR